MSRRSERLTAEEANIPPRPVEPFGDIGRLVLEETGAVNHLTGALRSQFPDFQLVQPPLFVAHFPGRLIHRGGYRSSQEAIDAYVHHAVRLETDSSAEELRGPMTCDMEFVAVSGKTYNSKAHFALRITSAVLAREQQQVVSFLKNLPDIPQEEGRSSVIDVRLAVDLGRDISPECVEWAEEQNQSLPSQVSLGPLQPKPES